MFTYEKEIQFAMSLVKEGSLLFLPAFRTHKVVEEKASSSDLVTGKTHILDLVTGKSQGKVFISIDNDL